MGKELEEKAVAVYKEGTEEVKFVMCHGRDGKTIERGYFVIGTPVRKGEYGDIVQEEIEDGQVAIHFPEKLLIRGMGHLELSTMEEQAIKRGEERFWAQSPRIYRPAPQPKRASED